MKRMTGRRGLFLLGVILVLGITNCASVQPWEREYLADESMQFDPNLVEAEWYLHVQEVMEGSRGGYSGTGGGCGCK